MSKHGEVDQPANVEAGVGAWVENWRAAVQACASPVGLVELPSTRILQLSPSAAELLGATGGKGVGIEILSVVDKPLEAAVTAWLLNTRVVDAIQARRRFRRPDGTVVEVPLFARAVRSHKAGDLVLWVTGDIVSRAPSTVGFRREPDSAEFERSAQAVVALDGDWRVARMQGDEKAVFGEGVNGLEGAPFLELVHPDDVAVLLLALARATCGPKAGERLLRLGRRDGFWREVAVTPTATSDSAVPGFSVALRAVDGWPERRPAGGPGPEEVLRRIAVELKAAGLVWATTDAIGTGRTRAMADLSPRQQEVVSRLMRGERVPRIAKAMYLSQSTIRNHLAAIFRKFGVHSQEELLAELRGVPLGDPPVP